jgi:CHAD domain-containing protein
VAAAKRLQDVLGEHQDAAVAEQAMRELAAGGAPRAQAAAELVVERQRARRQRARADFPDAWRQLRRRGRAAWS